MKKLPLSLLILNCPDDDEELMAAALTGAWFAEQKIFVSDRSTESSKEIARKFDCEIYEWTGPDSMAERRNYGIGYEGDEEYTPYWVIDPVMSKNPPKVRHEYILQADSDELYDWDSYYVLREFFDSDTAKNHDTWLFTLRNVNAKRGVMQSEIPLERMFKTETLHWRHDVHNEPYSTKAAYWPALIEHYGYEHDHHVYKQWRRIVQNEKKLIEDPTDIQARVFLINAITVAGDSSPLMFERMLAHVKIATVQYSKSPRDLTWQSIIQKAYRFYWLMAITQNKVPQFYHDVQCVIDDIKWHPDVPLWMYEASMNLERYNGAIEWGFAFLKTMQKFRENPPNRSIEIMTHGQERDVAVELLELLKNKQPQSKEDARKIGGQIAKLTADLEGK